jgi:uncharacterized DUF497 family protein
MLTFSYTRHARDALEERRIDAAWVERVMMAPDSVERQLAFGRVPERDGRVLRVVYAREGDHIRIITAFLDRARR